MNQENSTPVLNQTDPKTKTIVLIALAVAVFFLSFMAQALNVALPGIGQEFRANTVLLNWIVLAYVLAVAAFSVPLGRIADIIGIKKTIYIGLIVYLLSTTAAFISNSTIMLIICRAFQGMSASAILANGPALISAICSPTERGRALGVNITGVYLGSSTGPFLGGLLTQQFGWRSIFLINIFASLLLIVVFLWVIKGEWGESKGQKFDFPGSVIYAVSLVILMYGFSLLPDLSAVIVIAVGVIGILLFLKWENKIQTPMFNFNLFRSNKTFIFSNLASFINYSAVFAVAFLVSLYLQYIKGLTPGESGLVMISHPVVQAILSPIAGRLSDRFEPRIIASIGMGLTSIALFLFVLLSGDTPIWQIVITLIILGIGFSFFLSPNTNALISSVPLKYYGVASATMSTMIALGQVFSMGITMVVMAVVIGKVAITSEYYPQFLSSARIAFGLFTLLCITGVFVSFFRGKTRVS